ncbi:MAG TPA: adenylyltransferase/cytidyltransferase family protein [Nitrososphaerales archaeon]|nr:adenylyltransferase/cytidyltransferase family protein [Nitrososphaerales archaeon]
MVVGLDALDKTLLSSIYTCSLDGRNVFETVKERIQVNDEILKSRLDALTSLGMINEEMHLTDIGRDTLKVVFAGGVFDIIHPGHIHTLKSAKALGDVLVVSIARNVTAVKTKGNPPIHDEKLRQELVSSLKFVDLALLGSEEDIFKTVEMVKPNMIALGYDQVHQEKHIIEECKKRGLNLQVVRLQSPVPDLKSSSIKKNLGESLYKI